MKRLLSIVVFMFVMTATFSEDVRIIPKECVVVKGNELLPLYGKVKIVDYGEDLKVKIVDYGEDVRIKIVDYGADICGKIKIVDYGQDVKVKIVDYGEDIKVKIVEYGEGIR